MTLQLLVPLLTYPEGNSERLALHAAAIARHLDAQVHAAILVADFPNVSSAFGNLLVDVPAMVKEAKAKSQSRGRVLLKAFEAEMASLEIDRQRSKTSCFPGQVADVVAERARYYDLVLIGLGTASGSREAAEAAIFGSGRPVLLIPEAAPLASLERVLIAWDASRVAARAVADARDFIVRAKAVTIATVTDEKSLPHEGPGDRLADYLARHEVKSDVAQLQAGGRPIAETLQAHAQDTGAGLIVMGAFGHSRLREFVLGGATAGILGNLQIPALLSH